MEEQIFKVGDKVFDCHFGWGKVKQITVGDYPVGVQFKHLRETYSIDGRIYKDSPQTLSFTEYTLNGFSQERPIDLPEIGEMVMVSDDNENWRLLKVTKIENGKVHTLSKDWNYFNRLR